MKVFDAKRVPHNFLKKIRTNKEVHLQDFASLVDTVSPEERKNLKEFDHYFEFVIGTFEDFLDEV